MSYHQFVTGDGEKYGGFEVFHHTENDDDFAWGDDDPAPTGWYWRAGLPGCLPDGEPRGPFKEEQLAIDDALEAGY